MWRAQGVKTVFEKQVKGNVFELDGDKCQLQLPADDKKDMHLTMGILVIQGMVNSTFSLQLRVRDVKNDQHRVHLSTSVRGLNAIFSLKLRIKLLAPHSCCCFFAIDSM
jgi:hypothetical protein